MDLILGDVLRMVLHSADVKREKQHLCVVSVPTHDHDRCLHLFRSSKFPSVTHFSFKSSISFVTFVLFCITLVVNISVFKLNFLLEFCCCIVIQFK